MGVGEEGRRITNTSVILFMSSEYMEVITHDCNP